MNLNRLDLNLLVALDALLTERSTTRAGDSPLARAVRMKGL